METEAKTAAPLEIATPRITPAILALVGEIDEFKGAWRAVGRIAPDRLAGLRRVAAIESIGASARMDGATLTNREVELRLANPQPRLFATPDDEAAAAYAQVLETVFTRWDALILTERHIKQLHRALVAHDAGGERRGGAYKTLPNPVGVFGEDGQSLGVVVATASPVDTPRLMARLTAWVRAQERGKTFHPLLVAAVFIALFLEIRPFQDGNGALCRVLTTLLLLRAGYAYAPYSSLESVVEQNREDHDIALRRIWATMGTPRPDWTAWLEVFLTGLQQQKRRLEKKLEREAVILAGLPGLSVHILELTRERGRVAIAEAVAATGASRGTVKDHVRRLVGQGHLTPHGAGRGAWYAPG
jgi:Fic family protein